MCLIPYTGILPTTPYSSFAVLDNRGCVLRTRRCIQFFPPKQIICLGCIISINFLVYMIESLCASFIPLLASPLSLCVEKNVAFVNTNVFSSSRSPPLPEYSNIERRVLNILNPWIFTGLPSTTFPSNISLLSLNLSG